VDVKQSNMDKAVGDGIRADASFIGELSASVADSLTRLWSCSGETMRGTAYGALRLGVRCRAAPRDTDPTVERRAP
jgi:hypothetical protein